MTTFASVGYGIAALLLVVAFIASGFQMLRVCREVSGGRETAAGIAVDVGILVHLVTLCLVFRCSEEGAGTLVLVDGVALSVPDLLWANLPVGALVVFAAVREKRPGRLLLLLPLAATLPCAVCTCGRFWPVACAFDLAFFAIRMARPYAKGLRWGGQGVGAATPSEVLNLLPHGVLCADDRGRVILLNTAMRDCLASLGLKTDLGDARAIFRGLLPQGTSGQRQINLEDGRSFLVSIDDSFRASEGLRFAIAYDVSEEARVNRALVRANDELAVQNAELSRMLQNVLAAAGHEANLRMRGAVHDIVGQRLSILHRHLEDRDLDDETIGALRPLLSDLLEDLRPVREASPEAELSALVDAFGMAGVETQMAGALAEDTETARLQVRIVREAMSNALRHGGARRVQVALCQQEGCATVRVGNDGAPADAIIEGNGLTGLRRAVEERGGSFTVTSTPRFAIAAEIPPD